MRYVLAVLCLTLPLVEQAEASIKSPTDNAQLSGVHVEEFSETDEQRFNGLVAEVVEHFQDTVRAYGGTLVKKTYWRDDTVNATNSIIDNTWSIIAFGGLYRLPGMTADGFQLAICHEAGHLMGGYPNYGGSIQATSEGQSDYFAAQVCSRKIWRSQVLANQIAFEQAPVSVQENCLAEWSDPAEAHLCGRIALTAEYLIALLSSGSSVSLETPDESVASSTVFNRYPQPQCRVDTYYRGALCSTPWNFSLIPGRDLPLNSSVAEAEAHRYSCHRASLPAGARPECWYKQRVD